MCTLLGTFKYTLTNSKQHRAGPLTATWACPAVAKDPSLLRHQVILEGLDQQILALRVVTHQQLRIHVAHQEVPPQQRQPHTLHQLTEREREREMHAAKEVCDSRETIREESYPGHVLPASIYIMFHPAQHGSVHLLLRWDIEVVAGDQIQDLI